MDRLRRQSITDRQSVIIEILLDLKYFRVFREISAVYTSLDLNCDDIFSLESYNKSFMIVVPNAKFNIQG